MPAAGEHSGVWRLTTIDDRDRRTKVRWFVFRPRGPAFDSLSPADSGHAPLSHEQSARASRWIGDRLSRRISRWFQRPAPDPTPSEVARRLPTTWLQALARASFSVTGLLVWLVVLGIAALVFLTLTQGPIVIAMTLVSPVSATLFVVLITTIVQVGRAISRRADENRELALATGQCPACGYPIRDARPESDGCVCCPECGSAWRLRSGPQRERVVMIGDDRSASPGATLPGSGPI
ncbi:MAG: hypothetical protein SFZ23_11375 [Planctomycetota bacterium]|nr:hypothetical protein [Planctomycetota bacterium]